MIDETASQLRERFGEIARTCAGYNLRRASRAVSQHFDRALAPSGLRMTQFTLLGALALAGPCSMSRLAQGLVIDRTTLTRNLRLLRDAGLAEPASPTDRRLVLTARGVETLARAVPLWEVAQAEIVDAFGAGRWRGLVAELRALVEVTQAAASDAMDRPPATGQAPAYPSAHLIAIPPTPESAPTPSDKTLA
ncbi:MAG: winged helix-turn-helix transcriptional regulator [Chloroflexi bacterium]|nr:winged helix-turn-helix transcriptional regulator [Chloroflexota bacterium]